MGRLLVIAAAVAALFACPNAGSVTSTTGTLYYVSATGNDANSGTSASSAWKSIHKANTAVYPGDTVVLSGAFVKQTIAPSRSGTAAAPITYRASTAGASLDQPGLVGSTPYEVYLGARAYVKIDGLEIGNSNFVQSPVTNKGVVLRSSNHITFTGCTFDHMQMQLIGSDDNTIVDNTWRYFVATYTNKDPNLPTTTGDMLNIMLGSDRNLVSGNDMRYAGHSLIEIGNGTGASDVNADNKVVDNYLSNPWYKDLILSDDGAGTVAERNQLLDANSDPTLYSTVPGQVGQLQKSSDAVQISGSNFALRNNIVSNCVGTYGCITLGARWYTDSLHPAGVLVESMNNDISGNVVTDNWGAAAVSFVVFLSQADLNAGRTAVPRLTGNRIADNVFSGNAGTVASWNGSMFYSTFIYHSVSLAPPWVGENRNTVTGNQLDGGWANLVDYVYGGKTVHQQQTLSMFEAASNGDAGGNS